MPSPAAPAPDPAWLGSTTEDWITFWGSPQARVTGPTQLRALRRLFGYYDQRDRWLRLGSETPLVEGSTGQMTLNPLLKALPAMDVAILALEDRFGGSPLAAMKLGQAVGDAGRSLDELNRRLTASEASVDEEPDPRVIVLDATG